MSKIHHLCREQIIGTDLQTAWDFISSPQNLDRITPDDMDFEIVSKLPEQMYDGLLIEYRVGIPILGKQTWLTELKHIREQHSFVDEQRIGPYKLWYHYHEITKVKGGVRFSDQVSYVMPLGPLGAIARAIYVKNELRRIFDYRQQAMARHLISD
ncbi:SRPBCC family protein [Coraliomargarita algicola]|uniref:SRPBCC family protein n=1 Tax=Coraliomargarita algicola TaxID=3092156 RepID=A0ABZ0RR66_9BACT|nr:SRPBCC family protein [Coraliomargarita sp. J2-16]WPJ97387.1 SRPBCC family protein [Coraliomargarita sp. J2-16]